MALRKNRNYLSRPSNLFLHPSSSNLTTITNTTTTNHLEFDEADIWTSFSSSSSSSSDPNKNPIPASRAPRKARKVATTTATGPTVSSSLPVNIPDWSKILGRDQNGMMMRRENHHEDDEDYYYYNNYNNEEEDDDEERENELDDRLPPHEYVARKLARTRIVPFSVHEGVGRTLKGRDLSRVRNAVWKQIGFED